MSYNDAFCKYRRMYDKLFGAQMVIDELEYKKEKAELALSDINKRIQQAETAVLEAERLERDAWEELSKARWEELDAIAKARNTDQCSCREYLGTVNGEKVHEGTCTFWKGG